MKICLINPPSTFLTDERVFVPIGIIRLATYLKQEKYDVELIDLSNNTNWKDTLLNILNKFDIVGISSTTPQIPLVSKIAIFIKTNFDVKLVIGGPHITMVNSAYNNEIKKQIPSRATKEMDRLKNLFDVLVVGDGEFAFKKVIESDIKLVDSEKDKDLYITNNQYQELPIPNRDFIDINSYNYKILGERSTNLISQIGCPFGCNFCGGRYSKTFRNVRTRKIESVIKELDLLYTQYGYKGFMFFDDELNINNNKFNLLLDSLIEYQIKKDVKFKLRGFTRADLLTQEQTDKMYKAGFKWMLTGFESGSDRMLINMNKKSTIEKNTKACGYAKNSGLKIKALMSIGHSGESKETINETESWLKLIKPDETDITIISTYPGTPYYDDSVWDKDLNVWVYTNSVTKDKLYSYDMSYDKDEVYYKSKSDIHNSFVFTDHLTSSDIVKEREKLDRAIKQNTI